MKIRKKRDNALSGTRDRRGPDHYQRPAFDVGTRHRFVAAGAAGGAGREECHRLAPRFGAGVGPRQVSLHRADRDYADRRAVRRIFRRHARPAFDQFPGRIRFVARPRRCGRRRRRRHAHHLRVADRRRTGAEADRAARSRSGRGARRALHDVACADFAYPSCGCWIARARRCCGCSASAAKPRTRSAKTKSARSWSRPKTPACSSPAKRK